MTLAADPRRDARLGGRAPASPRVPGKPAHPPPGAYDNKPVEFWPTAAIRLAVESGDLNTWQRIVTALKRDPYGRTARQIEEVLEGTSSFGISKALSEVLGRARAHMEAEERTVVARQVRALLDRSGLGQHEFASRIGVSTEDLQTYLDADVSPTASQMVRMRRMADRFAKIRAQRSARHD